MKNNFKSIIALLLALVMVFALTACGGGSSTTPGGSSNAPANTATPEYAYQASFTKIGDKSNPQNFYPTLVTADGYYSSSWEKVGENIPEGATLEYEGQYDIYGNMLYFIGFDGSVKKLEGYTPASAEPQHENGNISSSLNSLGLNADGTLIAIENVSEDWNDAPEGVEIYSDEYWNYSHYEQRYYISTLAADGSKISSVEMLTPDNSENFYVGSVLVTNDGKLVFTSDTFVYVYNTDGTMAAELECDQYPNMVFRIKDGTIAVQFWEDKLYYRPIELDTMTLGDKVELPQEAYSPVSGSGEYDIYYSTGLKFFGYKAATDESVELVNWINCDVDSNDLTVFGVDDAGTIRCVENSYDQNTGENLGSELITLAKVPYDSIPHKESITLATVYLDYNIRSEIIKFNRTNDKYRIEIRDYSEYNTEDDYTAGFTKLTTEMLAGNIADIIDLTGMPGQQLAAKGILEDLYTFIDSDPEFSREDFFPNVLGAFESNGKLFSTCSGFTIQTVAAAASLVGTEPGWTFDDLMAALATMPEGCEVFGKYMTRDSMLETLLFMNMDSFINWSTGECNFESKDFTDLLNFASMFQKDYDYNQEWNEEDNDYNRVTSGRQMLVDAYIYSFDAIADYEHYFGEQGTTFIGYPTSSGNGSALNLNNGYGISASSANKQAAWDFLRYLFTEEYQLNQYNLPSNINAYKAKEAKAMEINYEQDMDGNYLLDENGNKIPIAQWSTGSSDGTEWSYYGLTQAEADQIWQLVTTTTRAVSGNSEISNIVKEQAAAFFEGQKSAEEVAKLVQNMVSIYVNEQR